MFPGILAVEQGVKGSDVIMLTHEKVLEIFKDYLREDTEYEVVLTSRGYTLMEWESKGEEWSDARFCKTPEVLAEALLDAYEGYLEYKAAYGRRDLTPQEEQGIQEKRAALAEKCRKAGEEI